MQKQLVRQLESQQRRRVEEANAALILQYEDLLWRAAETSVSEADLLADADVRATLSLADKSIADFVADLAGIRQRIAMQSQIEVLLAAQAEEERVNASLAEIDAEEAAALEAFEARRRPLRHQLRDCQRRQKETAPARKHYRLTSPDWLRKRLKAVDERLLKLETSQPSKPAMPASLDRSLDRLSTDLHFQKQRERRYADQMARYEARMSEWRDEKAERKSMIALLKCEQAALISLMLRLRPTEEDAQDG